MKDRPISKNKTLFMEKLKKEQKKPNPYQIPAVNLPSISLHYLKKLKVPIFINGSTEYGQKTINEKQTKYKTWTSYLSQYSHATFLVGNWKPGWKCPETYKINEKPNSLFKSKFREIESVIKKFFEECKITDLESDQENLSISEENLKWLEEYSKAKLSEICKKKINENIANYRTDIEKTMKNICLSMEETEKEMQFIQKELKSNETSNYYGYIHTGSVALTHKHFDMYLISKDRMIRSPYWNLLSSLDKNSLPNMYHGSLEGFLSNKNKYVELPHPQADKYSCCALGLANAKELLKQDASQLKNFTLQFKFYNDEGDLQHFFLTSPQTLRYAQSTSYNDLLKELVVQTRTLTFKDSKKREGLIKTIEQALKDSIEIAKNKDDKEVMNENKKLLEELPKFQKKWIAAYEEMLEKRGIMQEEKTASSNGLNLGLLYRGKKYEKIAKEKPKMSLEKFSHVVVPSFFAYKKDKILTSSSSISSTFEQSQTQVKEQTATQVTCSSYTT